MDAPVRYLLRDRNPKMFEAWSRCFQGADLAATVEISCGDIFGQTATAIVSPANSFGFMDGGIDLAYSQRFGWGLQERLQALLRAEHDGELPIGQAVILPTGDAQIPLLISAPTMRVPMDVSETLNAYLAFRAVVRAVKQHNRAHAATATATATPMPRIASVLCPGLCTAVGRMPHARCAKQMLAAYQICEKGIAQAPTTLGMAVDAHYRLLG